LRKSPACENLRLVSSRHVARRERARELRRQQTHAERVLWWKLRARQLAGKFRRQHPVGNYVVDFCSIEDRLIIEVDGGQRADPIPPDDTRTAALRATGYRVLRFWSNEVLMQTDAVMAAILEELRGSI